MLLHVKNWWGTGPQLGKWIQFGNGSEKGRQGHFVVFPFQTKPTNSSPLTLNTTIQLNHHLQSPPQDHPSRSLIIPPPILRVSAPPPLTPTTSVDRSAPTNASRLVTTIPCPTCRSNTISLTPDALRHYSSNLTRTKHRFPCYNLVPPTSHTTEPALPRRGLSPWPTLFSLPARSLAYTTNLQNLPLNLIPKRSGRQYPQFLLSGLCKKRSSQQTIHGSGAKMA